MECDYKGTEVMIGLHVEAKYQDKPPAENKNEKKEEENEKQKKGKRIEAKPPKFLENETREEFRRKEEEFDSYVERTGISGEDVTDDLYRTCETPLKQKLIASNKVHKRIKMTKPAVMMAEIKRLCLPKENVVLEREQFKNLKQEENEKINEFELRVRSKAKMCDFSIYQNPKIETSRCHLQIFL